MSPRHAIVPGLAFAALVGGCGGTKTITVARTVTETRTVTTAPTTSAPATTAASETAACAGSDVSGTFAVMPGSAGAGQIGYRLRLTNTSAAPCFVSGLPAARLLDAQGAPLPTHVTAAQPGEPTAVRVILEPGASASADARFSPDVPDSGETQTGACEPTASTLRVSAPGGGTADAPVKPPTPVCEHGTLSFSVFTDAR